MTQERNLEEHISELIHRLDGTVQDWNRQHGDQLLELEAAGDLSSQPARMYRRGDRILSLRFYPLATDYGRLRRGEILAGGTLGFPMANWGLNVILLRTTERGLLQWWALEASQGLNGPATHILSQTADELDGYIRRIDQGLGELQVVMRPFSDQEIRGFLPYLTAETVSLV
jgi:hypothetical protein